MAQSTDCVDDGKLEYYDEAMFYSSPVEPSRHGTDKVISRD